MIEPDRVFTFSVKPQDDAACNVVAELKSYCKSRGLSFSKVVVDALLHYVKSKKIKLNGKD